METSEFYKRLDVNENKQNEKQKKKQWIKDEGIDEDTGEKMFHP